MYLHNFILHMQELLQHTLIMVMDMVPFTLHLLGALELKPDWWTVTTVPTTMRFIIIVIITMGLALLLLASVERILIQLWSIVSSNAWQI